MHPVACKNLTIAALTLCNLILMMRENKIFPACMNINLFSKIFLGHYRALNMPAWAAFAPGRLPVRLSFFLRLPQYKIQRIFFLVFTGYLQCPEAGLKIIQILMRQLSIFFEFLYSEVNSTIICCICITFIY